MALEKNLAQARVLTELASQLISDSAKANIHRPEVLRRTQLTYNSLMDAIEQIDVLQMVMEQEERLRG